MKWLYLFSLCVALVASKNPDENRDMDNPDLFEGDMILTPDQRMAAELGLDVAPIGRAAIKGRQWPRGVMIYAIDRGLARDRRAMWAIKEGMKEWTRKTCIRFKKRKREKAYAYFKPGGGCSSYVGRTGRRQDITLARGCWTRGIVAHEIGHALGFFHEQSRTDRDRFVRILWQNIIPRFKNNFKRYGRGTIDSLGTPYDYGSVMHYGTTAFSKNRKPTILPKRKGVRIGQRRGISRTDARQMNLLYRAQCRRRGRREQIPLLDESLQDLPMPESEQPEDLQAV